MYLSDILLALTLTIIVEVIVAFLFGYKDRTSIQSIMLINLITNPVLNYLVSVLSFLGILPIGTTLILILEAFVVLIEWRLLMFALKKDWKSMLLLSLVMNMASYIIGIILFGLV